MHIRCKFDGGKNINRCFRGSFLTRCYGGSLRSLKGPAWSPIVYNEVTGKRADDVFLNTYRKRSKRDTVNKRLQSTLQYKQKRGKRKLNAAKISSSKKARIDYGPEVLDDTSDINAEQLERVSKDFYESDVKVTAEEIKVIERETVNQSKSVKWKEERRKRLTSSMFGEVMSRGLKNNRVALTQRMLYSSFQGNKFTRKGIIEEENTRKEYINMKKKEGEHITDIDVPGLVISSEHPHLAASSDGIVKYADGSTALIEIKNLLQNTDHTIKDAAIHQKQFCLKPEGNSLSLKKHHKYYYQVQGQLNILNQPWCDFVVRRTNPYDIYIERIYKDSSFWINHMVPKLTAFYETHLLPELAAPRKDTTTGIRKATIPWYNPKTSLPKSTESKCTSSTSTIPSTSVHTNTHKCSPTPSISNVRPSHSPTPSTSTLSQRHKRDKKTKFVGRRIKHKWEEEDGTSKWYTATVTGVHSGLDGDSKAVHQVFYEEEGETYDVEDLLSDYFEGSLIFIDV